MTHPHHTLVTIDGADEIGNCDRGSVITVDGGRDNNESHWRRPMMADEHGESLIQARRPTP
jgi:hypothetical protein